MALRGPNFLSGQAAAAAACPFGASKLESLIYWNCIHISPLGKVTWKIAP
jgi:hypothetical protein